MGKEQQPSADIRYSEAVALYRDTSLSITEIGRRCGVSRQALAGYIQRNHRELMFRCHGFGLSGDEAKGKKCMRPRDSVLSRKPGMRKPYKPAEA